MLNPLLEYPISGYIDSRSKPNRLLNILKSMIKRFLLTFLACLLPALCNAQDLGNCSRRDIPIVEVVKACKSVVTDSKYTKEQQARAAISAGLLNQLEKGSVQETIGLFLLAVDRGDLGGYSEIAEIYRNGEGSIKADYKKALDYYRQDSTQSSTKHVGLAELYLNGLGVDKDSDKAISFLWMAIGLSKSAFTSNRICQIYSDEKFGVRNLVKAHMWCSVSVKIEQDPQLKFLWEEQRVKLALQLNKSQLTLSNSLLEKCLSSSLTICETPRYRLPD
jgi:hypothetical protein